MTFIIAIDPGKTSGIAIASEEGERSFVQADFDRTCDIIESAVLRYGSDIYVVSESFLITQHTAKNTQAPWSLELIGVARRASRKHTGRDLVLQTPSAAKRFSSDARLKHMGYWTPGKGHANDAARHLLLFEASRGFLTKDKLAEFAQVS